VYAETGGHRVERLERREDLDPLSREPNLLFGLANGRIH
jgi:hypothetical protein